MNDLATLDAQQIKSLVAATPTNRRAALGKALKAASQHMKDMRKDYPKAFELASGMVRNWWLLGHELDKMGLKSPGRPPKKNDICHSFNLSDLGLSGQQSKRAQELAEIPAKDIELVIDSLRDEIKWHLPTVSGLSKLARQPKEYQPEKLELDPPPLIWHASFEDWLPTQPDCDLLLTDPPYMTDVDDIEAFSDSWLPMALDKVKPTGRAYVFIGAYPDELHAYLNLVPPDHMPLSQVLVWTYRNTLGQNPKDRYKLNWQAILYYQGVESAHLNVPKTADQFAVFDINAPDGRLGDRAHAWQKPLKLATILVQQATAKGDIVLDPFCCTGTFILAANKHDRIGYGCDTNKSNLAIARKRGCVNG